MDEIKIYKKEISKKYKKLDNEKLIQLYNENKIDELVNSLLPLVIYISNKYKGLTNFEDIIQYGNIGLLTGIKKFNIDKGDNIINICNRYIKYSILDNLQNDKNLIRLPLTRNVSQRTSNLWAKRYETDNITNFDCEDEDYVEPKISRKEMEDLLMTIPNMKYSKVQVFLDYIFIKDITYRVIAEKNGYTHQNVSLIIKDIISKIKKDKRILQRIGDMLKIN